MWVYGRPCLTVVAGGQSMGVYGRHCLNTITGGQSMCVCVVGIV